MNLPARERISVLDQNRGDMRIILNADDFGRSRQINAAIIRAHQEGVLTSASLMMAGEAVEDAVELAHQNSTLAVGLHVVVINGRSVLPPEQIPHLVNKQGYFSNNPVSAGVKYFASQRLQTELARELSAQFEHFSKTGLSMSHVNGHLHMHVHPTVFNQVIELADQYGAQGIRLLRDDLSLALRYDRSQVLMKSLWALIFGLLSRWGLRQLQGHDLNIVDRVYGLMQSGKMQEAYVVGILRSLAVSSAEIYFHPASESLGEALGPNPEDLASLVSPNVRRVITERGLCLSTYDMLHDSKGRLND